MKRQKGNRSYIRSSVFSKNRRMWSRPYFDRNGERVHPPFSWEEMIYRKTNKEKRQQLFKALSNCGCCERHSCGVYDEPHCFDIVGSHTTKKYHKIIHITENRVIVGVVYNCELYRIFKINVDIISFFLLKLKSYRMNMKNENMENIVTTYQNVLKYFNKHKKSTFCVIRI